MKVTLHNTDRIVTIDGLQVRVWEGETANGVKCHAYIARIACARDADASEFERDLKETVPLSVEVAKFLPTRLVT